MELYSSTTAIDQNVALIVRSILSGVAGELAL
jgi:hypothetical protein